MPRNNEIWAYYGQFPPSIGQFPPSIELLRLLVRQLLHLILRSPIRGFPSQVSSFGAVKEMVCCFASMQDDHAHTAMKDVSRGNTDGCENLSCARPTFLLLLESGFHLTGHEHFLK